MSGNPQRGIVMVLPSNMSMSHPARPSVLGSKLPGFLPSSWPGPCTFCWIHSQSLSQLQCERSRRTDTAPHSASFEFFNKIISCGRRGEDQGLGPPPLWSVAGEGGLRSGLEGSVGCGGRCSVPRPDPRLGDGGASSFGLRLRTGERCSRRGRSSFLGPKQGSSGRPRLSREGLVLQGLGL